MKKHFFVVAAVSISSQLFAQVAPAHREDSIITSLDEVILTANKYPNKTSLTGKVVTIITKEQLERSGGKDLSQLLTEQAGVFISGANSNAGKDKSIYLRGASVEHTLITIDGIPVYDPSGIGSNFDIRNLPLANIERIEILKGSQSTLYGSDAIAGVINIITKKSSSKNISGNVLASYGSNENIRTNAGINGKSGIIDYNAVLSFQNTNGINEAINKSNYTVTDKDGLQQSGIQFGSGIKPSDKIYIQPFFRYNKIKGDIDQGAFTDELDYTYLQKSWQAGLRNEFSLGKAKLNVLYNYNNINRLYTDDSVKSRNGYDTWSQGTYKGSEHFADIYLHIPVSDVIKITGGIDFRSSQSDQSYSSIGFFGPYKTDYTKDSLKQNQTGLYAAMNWNDRSGINIELGSRINFHSEYGSNAVFNINPSYFINKKIKLFANLSSAYRTPSLYQLFSEYGNKSLKPEAGFTTEAGVHFFSANDKFTGRAVGFSRHVKDVIFFYFNSTIFQAQYINQDKQKDRGIELELNYAFSKNTTLKAFYTYVTGEITTKTSEGKDSIFFNLLRRPKNSFGISFSSQLTKKMFISSSLSAFGKRQGAYFDAQTSQAVKTTLKAYSIWDVHAEYSFLKHKLKLFADFRNILDTGFTEVSGFNTLGFNSSGGVRFNF
jgi:vitamin B12 transporter